METAKTLFVRLGYENTTTQRLLMEAGASKGGLYHHFPSKKALFTAIFEQTSLAAIQSAMASAKAEGNYLERLIQVNLAWLEVVRQPEVASILLDQGPRVLGWRLAREVENRHSLALMIRAIEQAVDAGEIVVHSIELTARLINAMLAEASLTEAHNNKELAPEMVEHSIRQFIEGLRV